MKLKFFSFIFDDGELQKELVWAKFAHTAEDGKVYQVDYYNLDVIISVGYRVKSLRGTLFRIWANSVLEVSLQFIQKMNEWRSEIAMDITP
ncbi:MAG: RhuM family protein [Clostridiales Family XIII bacterium]|nr:virulence RhuM family protein [Clostridia bacterium]MDY3010186.1 RhuM family protein [Clostridiales Family XIII bacterium]